MNFRTDLAVESEEFLLGKAFGGVRRKQRHFEKADVTEIEIISDEAAKRTGKPKGKYVTVEMTEFSDDSELLDGRMTLLRDEISRMLPEGDGAVLVVGVGNEAITPDALGPKCVKSVFPTRHIDRRVAGDMGFDKLNSVCAVATGVLGQTGMETGEIIGSIAATLKPKAVVLVDALASSCLERIGRTVQITDTGITPGSGIGNSRKEISRRTLGFPVIALGVPTVVDAVTVAGKFSDENDEDALESAREMMVTPRDIDVIIHRAARMIALALNCALQPDIEPEILLGVV